MDCVLEKNPRAYNHYRVRNIDTVSFSKKLLGQVVFLCFLQKKGWFGVKRSAKWGSGNKNCLRTLVGKEKKGQESFFNDVLERMFYEALSTVRSKDYYSRFESRIPFLNGGLFEPFGNYRWEDLRIPLTDGFSSNMEKTKEGDEGTGILDVFGRYNSTAKEDEPLDRGKWPLTQKCSARSLKISKSKTENPKVPITRPGRLYTTRARRA